MKISKKGIMGIVAVLVLALIIIIPTALNGGSSDNGDKTKSKSWFAGITNVFLKDTDKDAELEENEDAQVSMSEQEESNEETSEPEEVYVSPFAEIAIINVEENLNVRAEASTDSEIVGKMFKGDAATILGVEGDWYKITSGNVNGYVKAEFCKVGEEAEAFAKELNLYAAKSLTQGLRIRQTPDGEVLGNMDLNAKLPVDMNAEPVEGWTAVIYKEKTVYVSSDYVEVAFDFRNALTIEEYNKKLEEAKKAGLSKKNRGAIAATVDDVTLMAAIIYCEAGDQSYEGLLAVGSVVCNRIRSSRFPNTLYEVIYQRGQFGPAMTGKLDRVLERGNVVPQRCYDAAREALSGVDIVDGRLFFWDVRSGHDGLIIGDHVFFYDL